MFYCNQCAKKRRWPTHTLSNSWSRCEICHEMSRCNDVPSSQLRPQKGWFKKVADKLIDKLFGY